MPRSQILTRRLVLSLALLALSPALAGGQPVLRLLRPDPETVGDFNVYDVSGDGRWIAGRTGLPGTNQDQVLVRTRWDDPITPLPPDCSAAHPYTGAPERLCAQGCLADLLVLRISHDGSVLAGWRQNASGTEQESFTWSSALGYLVPPHTVQHEFGTGFFDVVRAQALSRDGTMLAGFATIGGISRAIEIVLGNDHWTALGGGCPTPVIGAAYDIVKIGNTRLVIGDTVMSCGTVVLGGRWSYDTAPLSAAPVELPGATAGGFGARFSADGRFAVVQTTTGPMIYNFDDLTGTIRHASLHGSDAFVKDIYSAPDGRWRAVGSYTAPGHTAPDACVWDFGRGVRLISDLPDFPAGDLACIRAFSSQPSWILSKAVAISDDGTVIGGVGRYTNDSVHQWGWVLRVAPRPRPARLTLTTVAGLEHLTAA